MAKVKTITLNGKATEYDVQYTKAYVAKIISAQSDLYQELNAVSLPYNTVKEIYVDGHLTAELVGTSLLYVKEKPKHDPYVDRHEPPNAGMGRYKGHTVPEVPEEFDESHALDMVLNDMIESMTDEELEQFYKNENPPEPFATDVELAEMKNESKGIYLQSVSSPPPYWVTDTTAGNVDITYTN